MNTPTSDEIQQYVDQFADSILVKVHLFDRWRVLSVKELRDESPDEARRVELRLQERLEYPHRVLVL